jgi:predicted Rossmann fold nucleotide-binding protein DprA/Smf involved in DNA uptake
MARRGDSSLAALLLTQRLVECSAEPFRAREYWALLDVIPDPGGLLGVPVDDLTVGLDDDEALATRIAMRFDAATSLAFELERLEQSGIRVITSLDEDYPARFRDRLVHAAPPVLHVVGPIEILDGPALGIVGVREPSDKAADVARDAATRAVAHGSNVISGASPGIDHCAMDAALEQNGRVAGLLADSLLGAVREPAARMVIGRGDLCLATPYPPGATYSVVNAQGRNKLIFAASDTTLVVAADGDADTTQAGATEALDRGFRPVAVWAGPGARPGNDTLIAAGARPIDDLEQLFPGSTA